MTDAVAVLVEAVDVEGKVVVARTEVEDSALVAGVDALEVAPLPHPEATSPTRPNTTTGTTLLDLVVILESLTCPCEETPNGSRHAVLQLKTRHLTAAGI